jgi:hypothetical protein
MNQTPLTLAQAVYIAETIVARCGWKDISVTEVTQSFWNDSTVEVAVRYRGPAWAGVILTQSDWSEFQELYGLGLLGEDDDCELDADMERAQMSAMWGD